MPSIKIRIQQSFICVEMFNQSLSILLAIDLEFARKMGRGVLCGAALSQASLPAHLPHFHHLCRLPSRADILVAIHICPVLR